jgi:hypothetical protein
VCVRLEAIFAVVGAVPGLAYAAEGGAGDSKVNVQTPGQLDLGRILAQDVHAFSTIDTEITPDNESGLLGALCVLKLL